MKMKDLAAAGVSYGPGGYKCSCCRPKMTKDQVRRKLRRNEKMNFFQDALSDL